MKLQHLALKEKELQYMHDLETKKLEQLTKIHLRELELSEVSAKSADFDVSRNICLVPPFDERDVDK